MTFTADVWDQNGDVVQTCSTSFVQYGGRTAFDGPAVTISCKEDNGLLRTAASSPGEGRVLVVDGQGSTRVALMGDSIAALATENGWAGVVINGAVRDVPQLRAMDLGIKALATNPRKCAKEGAGERDVPVTFGDVTVNPGDHVYSDEDGLVVKASA